jgi:hypothetical protein
MSSSFVYYSYLYVCCLSPRKLFFCAGWTLKGLRPEEASSTKRLTTNVKTNQMWWCESSDSSLRAPRFEIFSLVSMRDMFYSFRRLYLKTDVLFTKRHKAGINIYISKL